jgi:hypothetical protein
MLHRYSNCSGQSQLQTVTEELFQANNDFDVEDSIVYKQWVHDGHTKTASMISTAGKFMEKICQTAHQVRTHHYSNITSFIFKDTERNYSARH